MNGYRPLDLYLAMVAGACIPTGVLAGFTGAEGLIVIGLCLGFIAFIPPDDKKQQ